MKRKETIRTIAAQYVCTFRPEPEGGYTVRCRAFPEIVTYGATLDEARGNAREAIELCLEVYRDKGWKAPQSEPDPRKTLHEMVPSMPFSMNHTGLLDFATPINRRKLSAI